MKKEQENARYYVQGNVWAARGKWKRNHRDPVGEQFKENALHGSQGKWKRTHLDSIKERKEDRNENSGK